jgi:hypothetical protein
VQPGADGWDNIYVRLTWNGGVSFTNYFNTILNYDTDGSYYWGMSGTEKWGRSAWTIEELNNTNFYVQVTSESGFTDDIYWLSVGSFGITIPAGSTIDGIAVYANGHYNSTTYAFHLDVVAVNVAYTLPSTNVNSERSGVIHGKALSNDERGGVTRGQINTVSESSAILTGSALGANTRGAILVGTDTAQTEIGACIVGQLDTFGEISAELRGVDAIEESRNGVIAGIDTLDSSIYASILGGTGVSDEMGTSICGIDTGTSDRPAVLTGTQDMQSEIAAWMSGILAQDLTETVTVTDSVSIIQGFHESLDDSVSPSESLSIQTIRGLSVNNIYLPKPNGIDIRSIEDGIFHENLEGGKVWDISSVTLSYEFEYSSTDATDEDWASLMELYEDHILEGEDVSIYVVWDVFSIDSYCLMDLSPVEYLPGTGTIIKFRIVLTELLD